MRFSDRKKNKKRSGGLFTYIVLVFLILLVYKYFKENNKGRSLLLVFDDIKKEFKKYLL